MLYPVSTLNLPNGIITITKKKRVGPIAKPPQQLLFPRDELSGNLSHVVYTWQNLSANNVINFVDIKEHVFSSELFLLRISRNRAEITLKRGIRNFFDFSLLGRRLLSRRKM